MEEPLDLRLPPPFRRPLEALRALDDSAFAGLVEFLNDCDPAAPIEILGDELSKKIEAPAAQTGPLLEFVLSTRRLLSQLSVSEEIVGRAIAAALADGQGGGPAQGQADDPLGSRVSTILRSRFAVLRNKAQRLAAAADQTVEDVHGISDLRPIFARGSASEVVGFLTLHMLELDTSSGADSKTLYLNLDDRALRKLKLVVDRELEKSETLRSFVASTQYRDLTVREEPS